METSCPLLSSSFAQEKDIHTHSLKPQGCHALREWDFHLLLKLAVTAGAQPAAAVCELKRFLLTAYWVCPSVPHFFLPLPQFIFVFLYSRPQLNNIFFVGFCFSCTSSLLLLLYPLPCPASHQSRVQACWGALPGGTKLTALWCSWMGSWSLCSVSGKDEDGWCG